MVLFNRFGQPVYKQYFSVNDITQQPEQMQQPQETQQGAGAKKSKNKLQKFSNLKINTMTEDKPKQKLSKFINLQL